MSEQANVIESLVKPGSRYLSFSLGQEEFAIPLLSVKEVIAVPEFTPIPFTPGHVLGIMNLRGQVISVIDLRKKLEVAPKANSETAVIICDLTTLSLGIVVDSVNSVLAPTSSDISPKPDIRGSRHAEFIQAVYRREKALVLFLDIAKALDAADMQAIDKSSQMKKTA